MSKILTEREEEALLMLGVDRDDRNDLWNKTVKIPVYESLLKSSELAGEDEHFCLEVELVVYPEESGRVWRCETRLMWIFDPSAEEPEALVNAWCERGDPRSAFEGCLEIMEEKTRVMEERARSIPAVLTEAASRNE